MNEMQKHIVTLKNNTKNFPKSGYISVTINTPKTENRIPY